MLLDPFTIVAQIVNFVVLVVALKLLLYDRVIAAMDARESAITERLEQAAEREERAEELAEEHRREQRRFERERDQLLDEARHEADAHRRELLEAARVEVEEQRQRWRHGLDREKEHLHRELGRRTAREVLDLTRSAMADLADTELEGRVLELALAHLSEDDSARDCLTGDAGVLTVHTAFPVGAHRQWVLDRLDELGLAEHRQVDFEHDERLVLGVEFTADGSAVAWNVADYLGGLAAMLDDLLDEDGDR